MPNDKRDIAADRKSCEVVSDNPTGYTSIDGTAYLAEMLPHYLDRCEEDEAALEAAIERLAHTCPPKHGSCEVSHETLRKSARRLDMDDAKCCHDCRRDYLVSEGKEIPTHA